MADATSTVEPDSLVEHVEPNELHSRMIKLKDQGYSMLLDIGGVDYPERSKRFDIVYHLLALPERAASVEEIGQPQRLRLIVAVGGEQASVPTLTDLWPSADWAEREIYDLFGVTFTGHPDMRRIQMPTDWEGYPLRKDYPVRGPAVEATPLPNFASKSNVPASTPPSGRVASALERRAAQTHRPPGESA
jgi:NADH/F420H2 dehydrogenase subunit C